MVDLCQAVKWSCISNGVLKTRQKNLFIVQNVRYSNGPPNNVTLPFEYLTPILSSLWFKVLGIQNSDGYYHFIY